MVQELSIRYADKIDEDELERQLRETKQHDEQTFTSYYDSLYSLALQLNLSDKMTEEITLKAFKAGVKYPGLRSYLVKEKPKDIASAYQAISEWEAMSRAAMPFSMPPRLPDKYTLAINAIKEEREPKISKDSTTFRVPDQTLATPPLENLMERFNQQMGDAAEMISKQKCDLDESRKEIGELKEKLRNNYQQPRGNYYGRGGRRGRGRGFYRGSGFYGYQPNYYGNYPNSFGYGGQYQPYYQNQNPAFWQQQNTSSYNTGMNYQGNQQNFNQSQLSNRGTSSQYSRGNSNQGGDYIQKYTNRGSGYSRPRRSRGRYNSPQRDRQSPVDPYPLNDIYQAREPDTSEQRESEDSPEAESEHNSGYNTPPHLRRAVQAQRHDAGEN